jgi:hypothetical protein
MFPTRQSITHIMTLAEVIERLRQQPAVTGLVTMGTTGSDHLRPESDYDLVVVLAAMPVALHVALTTVDGRLTDVIFLHQNEIETMLTADEPFDPDTLPGKLVYWLHQGEVHFDRFGHLTQIKASTAEGDWQRGPDTDQLFGVWFGANYNLQQTRRMMTSDDPVYQMAVDIRLLYALSDLWLAYFRARAVPWRGEKESVRWLQQHEPDFLTHFQQLLAESDRQRKMELYEQVAAAAIAPIGLLWETPFTAIMPDGDKHPDALNMALDFWNRLLTPEE